MSDTVETAVPVESSPVDPGLPLVTLERQLAPVRRVTAWATEQPAEARYVEANSRRWIDPLLELDLPAPLREPLVTISGQLAGLDTAPVELRGERLRRIRQELARLDAVLGLPLPRADRPRLRRRRPPRPEVVPDEKPASSEKPEAPSAREARRGRRKRRGERGAPKSESAPAPMPERRTPRKAFWNGHAGVALRTLDIDDTFADALEAAGILTVGQLLYLVPTQEEVLRPIHGAGRDLPEGRVAVGGRLVGFHTVCHPDGTHSLRAVVRGAGRLVLKWDDPAGGAALERAVSVGDRLVVVGDWDGTFLCNPVAAVEDGKSVRLVQYGLPGIDDGDVQRLLFRLLPGFAELRDPLPASIRPNGLSHSAALLALHGRGDTEAGGDRLAFEEALGVSLVSAWVGARARKQRGIQHTVLHQAPSVLLSGIDQQLSDAAEGAFDEIRRDLRRGRPMRRVLAGPPGGGKGLVAVLTAAAVADGKAQVLWVGGEAQLEADFAFSAPLLEHAGITVELLQGGRKPDGRLRDRLKRGETHVLFTTPEHIAGLELRRLGLVIASVRRNEDDGWLDQLAALGPPAPDVLVLPRTRPTVQELLGKWGDYAVSWLEGPSSPTVVVKTVSQRDSAYAGARHALHQGGQVAVLFPQINGRDALDPSEASRVMSAISDEALSGAKMTLLHGAMPRKDRVRTVEDVSHRRVEAVVATLPIEDLAPLPGIEVVVVEHAQRFDRRRLERIAGMGPRQISLVVGDDTPSEVVDELVNALRGPEEPLELPVRFRHFDPRRHRATLLAARQAALQVLTIDGALRNGAHGDLVRVVRSRWSIWSDDPCPLPEIGEGASSRRRRRRRRRR